MIAYDARALAAAARGAKKGTVVPWGSQGTLSNNWNKLDWRFCSPLAMKMLEWFAWWGICVRSPSDLSQHSV